MEANSHPMMPPPTISMLSGSWSISRAVVDVRTAGSSGSMPGSRAGSDPVAMTTVGAESSAARRRSRHPVRGREPAVAVDHGHAPALTGLLHAAAHLGRDAHGPVAHRGPVDADLAERDAPVGGLAQPGHELRRGEQRLGRDAAAVDAGAAQQVALDQDHARAELGRPQGRDVARRPAAEHQDAGVRHAYPGAAAGAGGRPGAGGGGLVEAPHRRGGRLPGDLGVVGGLPQDLGHDVGERLQRLAGLQSRWARPGAPPPPAAGSRPSAGGSRSRAGAWRDHSCGCRGPASWARR